MRESTNARERPDEVANRSDEERGDVSKTGYSSDHENSNLQPVEGVRKQRSGNIPDASQNRNPDEGHHHSGT